MTSLILCPTPIMPNHELWFEILGGIALLLIAVSIITGFTAFRAVTKDIKKEKTLRVWLWTFGLSITLCLIHFSKLFEYQYFSMWHGECRTFKYYLGWYAVHILGAIMTLNFHSIILYLHLKNLRLPLPKFLSGFSHEN